MVGVRTIDKEKLQMIQDLICSFVGVSGVMLDLNRSPISSISNDHISGSAVSQLLGSEYLDQMLDNVRDDSPEDICIQSIEDSEDGMVRVGVVSIKPAGKMFMTALVTAPGAFRSDKFAQFLDFMKATTESYLRTTPEDEISPDRLYSGECDDSSIRILETTKNILELLDSDEGIESVFRKWVSLTSAFLGVDFGGVFRLSDRGIDVVARYDAPLANTGFDSVFEISLSDIPQNDGPLIISSEAIDKQPGIYNVGKYDIKSFMYFPLLVRENGEGTFISFFVHRAHRHNWDMDEIRFAGDAVRIMQSIIQSRLMYGTISRYSGSVTEILDNVGCCVYLTQETTGKVLFANRMLIDTFGADWQEGDLQEIISKGDFSNPVNGSFEIYYPESRRWFDLMYKRVEWVDGSPAMLHSLYDVTDRRLYQRKIEQQAFTDFLTGLYNRMCCEKDLARLVDEARLSGKSGAVIFIDLDDFKHINDGLGHQYGDVLLKEISGSLQKITGVENFCYRMGGDEFVILIPPEAYEHFEEIKECVVKVFSSPWIIKEIEYYCTASIGTVTFPDYGDNVLDLLKKADIAMYSSKKSGKNRITEYTDDQETYSGRRLDMEKNMRDASSTGYKEFEVYYQPIIDVENGKPFCAGAEALVRWNSNKMGFISPSDFIPLAEYLGLINPIGGHVLEKACENCREWNEKYGLDYKVNVNLSVVQLLQNDIVESVEETIKRTGIDPRHLCLEVTESLAINDMPRMIEILTRIKALGCTIALDDFGTGYSSLNHIREIPFDIIKVDQSFVRDLDTDAYAQSFVRMVAELAETIGVKICVEGIENKDQLDKLDGMKIKYIQGYYFDKPLVRQEFEKKYVLETKGN
ncbi:MAG: bifunctional diguanylate cyclase/phosphodiesterase [Lachnospiraceae bacterium]|nr:bifunctional diguanylate cyclase/phosphodiesterase [Lachnospiraceae bacterium]